MELSTIIEQYNQYVNNDLQPLYEQLNSPALKTLLCQAYYAGVRRAEDLNRLKMSLFQEMENSFLVESINDINYSC